MLTGKMGWVLIYMVTLGIGSGVAGKSFRRLACISSRDIPRGIFAPWKYSLLHFPRMRVPVLRACAGDEDTF